jgi:DNA polymerase-3 subunit beta
MPLNNLTSTLSAPRKQEALMEIHCQKEELLKGVQLVQNAISPRSTLPVLANILVEATAEGLRLSSTDLEVGIRCHVKADVKSGGVTTVPARTLGEFLRTLDDGRDLSLKMSDNQKMEIRSGRDRCVLACLPKDDYPVLPEFSLDKAISLNQVVLREMIRKTAFSVSTDETRYVLNGVNCMIEKGKITLVATDGRRLAYIQRDLADAKAAVGAIIPTKAINELARILSTEEKGADVQMGLTENQVTFQYRDIIIISRLIEGNFPNFDQVIPKTHDIQLRMKTRQILQATQRAAVGTMERGGSVRFSLTPGSLHVSASAQGRIEVESEIEVGYKGDPFAIAFNPAYMVDVFKALETDEVLLELSTPLNPGVIRPVGDENN